MVVEKHRKRPLGVKDWIIIIELQPGEQGFCGYFAGSGGMFERVCGECLFGVVGKGAEAIAALYFTQCQPLNALIAWTMCKLGGSIPDS
ncbi:MULTISPECIES: hypothetical protein [unclassified Microcoleus]|uniref:hypothetical protein n=1 Tax=unclassified Microcoleus TaxID=2642155 RepID=UPI002FCF91D9